MKEGFKEGSQLFSVGVEASMGRSINQRIIATAENYIRDREMAEGLREFLSDYFDAINIHPQYKQTGRAEFGAWREHLKSDPGVVIANHPDGHFDIPAVLKTFAYRDDVKIMVQQANLDKFSSVFGRKYVVPAAMDIASLRDVYQEVGGHIRSGGLFFIFPGGGNEGIKWNQAERQRQGLPEQEENALPQIKFEDFVPSLIQRVLRPSDMVYSFYINPADIAECLADLTERNLAMLPHLLREEVDTTVKLAPKTFLVDERYSQASEWQSLIAGTPGAKRAPLMTEHYLSQFITPLSSRNFNEDAS